MYVVQLLIPCMFGRLTITLKERSEICTSARLCINATRLIGYMH
jgi:hypothetical protein